MPIYRVTKLYRVKKRNYNRDNSEKLHSSHAFFYKIFDLQSPTEIKSEIHVCLKSILRDLLNNISLSTDKELG